MKRKMAFVDLTNFKDWPMGGMLEYELAILPYLAEYYDLDIWGYSLNGVIPMPLVLNGKEYPVHVCGNCSTNRRIIPNFWRGLSIFKHKSYFLNRYDIVYAHTGSCMCAFPSATCSNIRFLNSSNDANFICLFKCFNFVLTWSS